MRDFHFPGRSPVYATRAMAATSHPLATETAIATLRAGGTAADAAVAACAVLTVVEPHMVSAAGDCFWIVGKPGKPLDGYNGSGRSAKTAKLSWFRERGVKQIGDSDIHSVTVPGAVDAWAALAERHGRFGFDRLLQRAIEVAEEGHPVAPRVALDWSQSGHRGAGDPGFRKHFLKGGRTPRPSELHVHKPLGRTYRLLAKNGPRAMYEGEIAEDMVATLKARGSLLTLDDFAAHRGEMVKPITATYRGKSVAEIPPNGQGLVAHVILNAMEPFDLPALDPLSAERFHIELEATRLGYALRDQHIAELGAMTVPLKALAAKSYGRTLAKRISMDKRIDPASLPPPAPETHTVYLSIVDEDRLTVSFICSIFSNFGVGIATEKTGLVLQNRGSAFRMIDGHPNAIGPSKRPLHTIIPGMVLNGRDVIASFGVMGGAYQACGHAHVLSNMVDYGMDPQAALDFPRAFFAGDALAVERSLPAATIEGLARRGHPITVPHGAIGGGQVIAIDPKNGILTGASDPRKDGCALGY
jgi:gamma-glutamyltranspeptidase/glutathione hydrolase